MLVSGAHHVVQLIGGKLDLVSLIPLEQFVIGLVRAQPKQAELRGQANRAVVPVAGLNVALPDRLQSGAGKVDML